MLANLLAGKRVKKVPLPNFTFLAHGPRRQSWRMAAFYPVFLSTGEEGGEEGIQ